MVVDTIGHHLIINSSDIGNGSHYLCHYIISNGIQEITCVRVTLAYQLNSIIYLRCTICSNDDQAIDLLDAEITILHHKLHIGKVWIQIDKVFLIQAHEIDTCLIALCQLSVTYIRHILVWIIQLVVWGACTTLERVGQTIIIDGVALTFYRYNHTRDWCNHHRIMLYHEDNRVIIHIVIDKQAIL